MFYTINNFKIIFCNKFNLMKKPFVSFNKFFFILIRIEKDSKENEAVIENLFSLKKKLIRQNTEN